MVGIAVIIELAAVDRQCPGFGVWLLFSMAVGSVPTL